MDERYEEVVIQPAGLATVMHLGIHATDRTRKHQGLIGQVAAEVQQGATAGRGRPGIGPEPLEPRLEDGQLAE